MVRGLLIPTTPPTVATTPPWVFIEGARVVSPVEFVLEILGRLTEIVVFIGVAVCLLFVFVVTWVFIEGARVVAICTGECC